MVKRRRSDDLTWLQWTGAALFVFLCEFPAASTNGFTFDGLMSLSLGTLVFLSLIGGAVGGMLYFPKPPLAGLIGGLVAGPLTCLAVYYYTLHRERLFKGELALVMAVAALPGIAVGFILNKVLTLFSSDK